LSAALSHWFNTQLIHNGDELELTGAPPEKLRIFDVCKNVFGRFLLSNIFTTGI